MSFKGSSTNSSLLKNSISSKKLLEDNTWNISAKRHFIVSETTAQLLKSDAAVKCLFINKNITLPSNKLLTGPDC